MPPNSSPTFTPHTPTSLVQLLVYKPCSVSFILTYSVLLCSRKEKFYYVTNPLLTPLHSALLLSFLLLTPLPLPPSRFPPTRPTHPTRLILPIPLHNTAHPCLDACYPCPSKSFPPAVLASLAALSLPSAALTPPSYSSLSDPTSPTPFLSPPLPPTLPPVLFFSLYPLHHS